MMEVNHELTEETQNNEMESQKCHKIIRKNQKMKEDSAE